MDNLNQSIANNYFGSTDSLQLLYTCITSIKDRADRGKDITSSREELIELINQIGVKLIAVNHMSKKLDVALLNELDLTAKKLLPLTLQEWALATQSDILAVIFSNCSFKDIGQLSSVSKKFLEVARSDNIWKAFCFNEQPEMECPINLTWKEFFRTKVSLHKFIGLDGITMYDIAGTNISMYLDFTKTTIKDLKIVFKTNARLNIPVSKIKLTITGVNDLTDDLLLKSFLKKEDNNIGYVFY